MPIVDLQRRLREIGRIRLGEKVDAVGKNGKPTKRPAKLEAFRLTSRDRRVIESAATLWGGQAQPWEAPDGQQWEVFTSATEFPVVVPPGDMAFSQWYEEWSAAGCLKRCDGSRDIGRDCPCDCDPSNRTCVIHTRLSVMLPELPGLGVWRVESHGYYSAVELGGAVDVCQAALAQGRLLPARLRLEQRMVKRIERGKPTTFRFGVIALDVDSLPAIAGGASQQAPTIGGGGGIPPATAPAGHWQPVGELPEAPMISVADQVAELDREIKPRKGAAEPIKPTGLKPGRKDAGLCDLCGEPYGTGALKRNPEPGARFVHAACLAGTAASQGADGGRGGTDSDGVDPDPVTEPTPAAGPEPVFPPEITTKFPRKSSKPSATQRSKMYALAAEVFSLPPTETRQERELLERAQLIALCTELGRPGLTSRTEIDTELCSDIIDALEACRAGTLVWDGQHLIAAEQAGTEPPRMIDPDTGEILL